jgi:hypothetical protein
VKFAPLSQKELSETNLIPEGYYRYRVVEAEETKSKAGADMIKLKVEVDVDGRTRTVFDYLLAAMMHKLYHFCEINNILDKYENGTLGMIDCRGAKTGFVDIVTQKDKEGKYPDRSGIKDYCSERGTKTLPANQGAMDPSVPFNDTEEIPF